MLNTMSIQGLTPYQPIGGAGATPPLSPQQLEEILWTLMEALTALEKDPNANPQTLSQKIDELYGLYNQLKGGGNPQQIENELKEDYGR